MTNIMNTHYICVWWTMYWFAGTDVNDMICAVSYIAVLPSLLIWEGGER